MEILIKRMWLTPAGSSTSLEVQVNILQRSIFDGGLISGESSGHFINVREGQSLRIAMLMMMCLSRAGFMFHSLWVWQVEELL